MDSWKEIAAYLKRSERTVRRWEHTHHLPVHRLSGSRRATVFALESELANWWRQYGQDTAGPAAVADSAAKRRSRSGLWIGGALAIAAGLVLVGAVTYRPRNPVLPSWKQLTFDTGSTLEPAISRDGKLIVYSSDRSGRGDHDIYVQPLAGGPATRLTYHEARDSRPDISPDGSRVVFHSYRDGGGLYVMPVTGGKETRIAGGGDYPRFSPDGTRVAFDRDLQDGSFAIFVASAAGGSAIRVTPATFRRARRPLWSPDGKQILFIGSTYTGSREEYDWWAAAVDGGSPVRTGVAARLIRQGMPGLLFFHAPLDWLGNEVVFVYSSGGTVNLWRIALSPRNWQVAGPGERLTSGTGREKEIRIAAGNREKHIVVAASGSKLTHLWEFGIDPDRAVVAEPGRPLTADTSMQSAFAATRPSLSASGDMLVYATRRAGNYDVWLQDLKIGQERPLAAGPLDEVDPILSRDGSAVVFMRPDGTKRPVLTVSVASGETRQVCDDCGTPTDWSPDGRHVLYISGTEKLGLLDVNTGARLELPSTAPVLSATFAPDARTIAVGARSEENERVYLVPFEDGRWPSAERWVRLSDLPASAAIWSPRGNLAYFLSVEDEYRCLWAQRLVPRTRQLVGRPFAVKHFHTMQWYPQMSRWLAIAKHRLVLRLTRENNNIWSAELP